MGAVRQSNIPALLDSFQPELRRQIVENRTARRTAASHRRGNALILKKFLYGFKQVTPKFHGGRVVHNASFQETHRRENLPKC